MNARMQAGHGEWERRRAWSARVRAGVLGLWLLAGAAHAELRVGERTVHYDLDARSLADLREQIRLIGPRDEAGRRYDGLTSWTIEWSAEFGDDATPGRPGPTAPRCRVDGHAVTLDLTITLPRWAHRHRAARDAGKRWDAYLAALVAHENQHRALALDAAQRIDTLLRGASSGGRCRDFQWHIEKAVNRIQQRLGVENRLLDARTRHGREQGVQL